MRFKMLLQNNEAAIIMLINRDYSKLLLDAKSHFL
jgi:hypothetical protein